MARIKMVTRTVEQTTYEVMCVEVSSAMVVNMTFKLGASYGNEDSMKRLKKLYETDDLKLVSILSENTESILYGMPEAQFIQLATVLPPRSTNSDEE